MRDLLFGCFFGAIAIVGCGGETGGSGGSGGATTTTSTGGSGGATAVVACTGDMPSFPEFDRTCTGEADCVIAFHQINCCGTRKALGIAKSAEGAFNTAEATCESQYPACGCAQGPTMTDEGSTATDESQILVQCLAGACSTYVP